MRLGCPDFTSEVEYKDLVGEEKVANLPGCLEHKDHTSYEDDSEELPCIIRQVFGEYVDHPDFPEFWDVEEVRSKITTAEPHGRDLN